MCAKYIQKCWLDRLIMMQKLHGPKFHLSAEPGSFSLKSKNWMISCCSLSHTASLELWRDPQKRGFPSPFTMYEIAMDSCVAAWCKWNMLSEYLTSSFCDRIHNIECRVHYAVQNMPKANTCGAWKITLVVRWLILLMGFRNTAVATVDNGESSKSRGFREHNEKISTGYLETSEASPIWGFILPDHSHPVCESQTKPSTPTLPLDETALFTHGPSKIRQRLLWQQPKPTFRSPDLQVQQSML